MQGSVPCCFGSVLATRSWGHGAWGGGQALVLCFVSGGERVRRTKRARPDCHGRLRLLGGKVFAGATGVVRLLQQPRGVRIAGSGLHLPDVGDSPGGSAGTCLLPAPSGLGGPEVNGDEPGRGGLSSAGDHEMSGRARGSGRCSVSEVARFPPRARRLRFWSSAWSRRARLPGGPEVFGYRGADRCP